MSSLPAPTPVSDPVEDLAAETRAAVNRANAAHSCGPRTLEGKQAVRLNALKHGMFCATAVLPHEDRNAYESFGARLRTIYRPEDPDQEALVAALQDAHWRLDRLVAMEHNLLTLGTVEHLDSVAERYPELEESGWYAFAQAEAFISGFPIWDKLQRYQARMERAVERMRKQLDAILELRAAPAPHPVAPAQPAPAPQTGFVPPVSEPAVMPHFTGGRHARNLKKREWLRQQSAAKTART